MQVQKGDWMRPYKYERAAMVREMKRDWIQTGVNPIPLKLKDLGDNFRLADFLHRLVEGGPFFFQAFFLDLSKLRVGNLESLRHDLV